MEISKAIKTFVDAGGKWGSAAEAAQHQGVYRAKAAVGGSGMSDLAGSFQTDVNSEFLSYLQEGPSAFDRIRPYSRLATFHTPLLTPASPLSAEVVAEGKHLPVTKLSNASDGFAPVKVGGLAVASKEALETSEGMASFVAELRSAVGVATDAEFLSSIGDDADTSQAASSDAVADIQALLDGVNTSGFGRLFFACTPDVANLICTLRAGTGESRLFPRATPTGGEVLGVPLLVSAGAPTDTLTLLDASAVCTGAEDLQIKMSDSAMVEMDDSPAGETLTPTGATGALISVFQADCVALLGIRSFAAKLVRTSGCGYLTSVTASSGWGA